MVPARPSWRNFRVPGKDSAEAESNMTTRTGNFPIALRRGWGDWQKNNLRSFLTWIKEHGFEAVDLMNVTRDDLGVVKDVGLRLGSADLLDFGQIMASDTGKRREVIAKNVQYVSELGAAGVKVFFTCVIPGDATKPRSENYALAVESYSPIAPFDSSARAYGSTGASPASVVEGDSAPTPSLMGRADDTRGRGLVTVYSRTPGWIAYPPARIRAISSMDLWWAHQRG